MQRSLPASSLAIVNKDLEYLHQHAGKELGSVREAHDVVSLLPAGSICSVWLQAVLELTLWQVAGYLNPVLGEQKEQEIEEQVDVLQSTLQSAHEQVSLCACLFRLKPAETAAHITDAQVHQSESLLEASMERLSALERSAAKFRFTAEGPQPQASTSSASTSSYPAAGTAEQQPSLISQPQLQVSSQQTAPEQDTRQPKLRQQQQQLPHQAQSRDGGRTLSADTGLPPNLQNFWFPAEFSSSLKQGRLLALQLFEQPWVLFRDAQGQACCIRDTCAHRACPLSLGSVHQVCAGSPSRGCLIMHAALLLPCGVSIQQPRGGHAPTLGAAVRVGGSHVHAAASCGKGVDFVQASACVCRARCTAPTTAGRTMGQGSARTCPPRTHSQTSACLPYRCQRQAASSGSGQGRRLPASWRPSAYSRHLASRCPSCS